jgi:long-chain acyl-CoA synthetase
MVINPDTAPARLDYLIDKSDYSVLITPTEVTHRNGNDYPGEKLVWYTSGTTGDSKFYSFSQEQLDRMAQVLCDTYDITENDRYCSVMPLWHSAGQSFYWAAKHAGCQLDFLNVSNIRSLPKYNPTFIFGTPDILKISLHLDIPELRFIRAGAGKLDDALYNNLVEKFKSPVIAAYGLTETMGPCMSNPLYGEQRLGTVGLPMGVEAKIENSRLHVRGPNVCAIDWLDTGDIAEQDSAGYYKILGRDDDRIDLRSTKVNPVSVEQHILNSVPGVIECAVFGKNSVKCIYVGDSEVETVNLFIKSLGFTAELIKQVDVIPKNFIGKVSRPELNSLY